tara:strand:+ start:58 stop:303 length:246 start_codon:yes stop_codon:yes gene_type:complete
MENTVNKSTKTKKPRCALEGCKKKLLLTALELSCRCGKSFCTVHRMPESHKCVFDYKTINQINKRGETEKLKCVADKIIRI